LLFVIKNSGGQLKMRFLFTVLFIVSVVVAGLWLQAQTADNREADRNAILAHIDSVFQAYMNHDRTAVRETHTQNWRGFIRPSRSIIRGIDQYMNEAEPILASPYKIKSYKIVDSDITFYGDTAFVSYIADLDTEVEGIIFHDKLRVVDLYVKEHGKWNQAGSQVATHPDVVTAFQETPQSLTPSQKNELVSAREAVWRAWFSNDQPALEKSIPAEVIAINADEQNWGSRASIFSGSKDFVSGGSKLVNLEFPKTEIQIFGDVAILYSQYLIETEKNGQRESGSGRGTEIFVHRNGVWVNSGWHLDSGK
jgi:ketosteroid isomerase-like protein